MILAPILDFVEETQKRKKITRQTPQGQYACKYLEII